MSSNITLIQQIRNVRLREAMYLVGLDASGKLQIQD